MKMRVDAALVNRGMVASREKAQALIMAGQIYIGEKKVLKASETIEDEQELVLRGEVDSLASRGGHKLERAITVFGADVTGVVAMDIGAAAGGFTDVLLRHGAAHVYAIDVGYGQLDWKLRSDARVVSLERTNARNLTHEEIPEELDFASVDVSFISLKLILPALARVLKSDGHVVCLVKPQFEAGKEKVGKKGVVRDPAVHQEVLEHFLEHAKENDFTVLALDYSPIRGPEGNIEYLGYLALHGGESGSFDLAELVERSHGALTKEGV